MGDERKETLLILLRRVIVQVGVGADVESILQVFFCYFVFIFFGYFYLMVIRSIDE